jgi:hypothetical protein
LSIKKVENISPSLVNYFAQRNVKSKAFRLSTLKSKTNDLQHLNILSYLKGYIKQSKAKCKNKNAKKT